MSGFGAEPAPPDCGNFVLSLLISSLLELVIVDGRVAAPDSS
jgi:hypothetical protein